MKKIIFVLAAMALVNCKGNDENDQDPISAEEDATLVDDAASLLQTGEVVELSLEQANKLAQLPLDCINVEYPNKLNQTLTSAAELGEPKELHPAFYGCFDWHSSVHGHWTLVSLLKRFSDLKKSEAIREELRESLSRENRMGEEEYFRKKVGASFERTYGGAWLLKVAGEMHPLDDPLERDLEGNLQALT